MPQFDATTFPSQLFWLAVSFVLLYYVLTRVALPRISSVLDERQRRISADLERAETLKAEAEEVLDEYEQTIADTRSKAHDMIRETKDRISERSNERQRELGEQIAEKMADAEERIDAARKQALENIRQVATDVAQEATKMLVGLEVDEEQAKQAVAAAHEARR